MDSERKFSSEIRVFCHLWMSTFRVSITTSHLLCDFFYYFVFLLDWTFLIFSSSDAYSVFLVKLFSSFAYLSSLHPHTRAHLSRVLCILITFRTIGEVIISSLTTDFYNNTLLYLTYSATSLKTNWIMCFWTFLPNCYHSLTCAFLSLDIIHSSEERY